METMKNIKSRLKRVFRTLSQNRVPFYRVFEFYVKYRKYKISFEEYIEEKLYDKTINHSFFLRTKIKYKHSWENNKNVICPNTTLIWDIFHYIEYLLFKLQYTGLDSRDYFFYRFFEKRHELRKTFVTEGYLKTIDNCFNGYDNKCKETKNILENKEQFNLLFYKNICRKWIYLKTCNYSEFKEFCSGLNEIIVKPNNEIGGKEISKVKIEKDTNQLFEHLKGTECIAEEIIKEDKTLLSFHKKSVNTIRINSICDKANEIHIISSVFRIGVGDSITDNYSSGGLCACIDVNTGIVISPAICDDGTWHYIHPDTKKTIIGFKVPKWDEIVKTIKKAHKKIMELKYVSWDVVINTDNAVVLIEANTCGGVEIQQTPNQFGMKPIFDGFIEKMYER